MEQIVRPLSAMGNRMKGAFLRRIRGFTERTETRLIRHALKHHNAGTDALLSHLSALGAEIVLPLGDHALRVPPNRLGKMFLCNGAYERDIFERALSQAERRRRLRNGGLLIDVGANIGMHTIYGHLSGRFDRVLSVEPSGRNFHFLELNVRENNLADKTLIV